MHLYKVILLSISSFFMPAAFPQQGKPVDSVARELQIARALRATVKTFNNKTTQDTTLAVIEAISKYDTLLKRELNGYYVFGMTHRKKVFEWNLQSSKITFWVVVFLVITGILFAGIQFYIALKEIAFTKKNTPANDTAETRLKANEAAPPGTAFESLKTQLEAGKDGVKLSSPVLGVIILVISLLFFYLYLAYVYPIQESF